MTQAIGSKNPQSWNPLRRFFRWFAHGVAWRVNDETLWLGRLLGPVTKERFIFYDQLGYIPHLRRPRTFSEKICHRKLFHNIPQAAMLADKLAVRKFVAERGYPDILNELLLVTRLPEEIDFAKLPQRFVIKATHGSGWNILVRNKQEIVPEEIVGQCNRWLKSVYGGQNMERHYQDIPPAILVEKFLFDTRYEVPLDYKFHVFHGITHFIQVDYGRYTGHTQTIYNTAWEAQNFTFHHPQGIVDKKPSLLGRMLEIAETLARDLDYCRVDLYAVNDRDVYFGEMTLTPWAGYVHFKPDAKADYLLGSLW